MISVPVAGSGEIHVLSVDGGGVRGLIPAVLLERFEESFGPCVDRFEVMAGTSTGGLLALALARPASPAGRVLRASDMRQIYENQVVDVFPQRRDMLRRMIRRAPAPTGLERAIAMALGNDYKMSQARTEVCVPAYDINADLPVLFTRYHAAEQGDPSMAQVARATSAAPTYFPPYTPSPPFNREATAYIDGGVFANNPALLTVAALRAGEPKRSIRVLSIGTGVQRRQAYADPDRWRGIEWLLKGPGLDVFLRATSGAADAVLTSWLNADYLRIQADLGDLIIALDDNRADTARRMRQVADRTWNDHEARLISFLEFAA